MEKKKQTATMDERLNTLRAGVLGSNDGILTVVGVLFSVAVATPNIFTIFIAGLSDLLACAFSMASGEYASVSSQRDAESSSVEKERYLLKNDLAKKPLETMVSIKYNIELNHYMNPWSAAFSSLFSAALGGLFPLLTMSLTSGIYRWPATILAVIVSVGLTGFLSAKLGDGKVKVAVIRNIIIGILTMIIHYAMGKLMNEF